ncbi:hypothetical protein VP01_1655g4 [Puccinia sorghi]|uniref:alpha-1,2-Mannosidase n=1 Tax=Puccinia sorghi TaxID=27349 RepID=A0A0L6VGJ3_9BASI|nr:hypothetical protein VP01_1655g4 [Puccinia sorghi]
MSSSKTAANLPGPGMADLLRSRLRALSPWWLILMIALSIYFFFRSVQLNTGQEALQQQHPHFRLDGLGRIGSSDVTREDALIMETDQAANVTIDLTAYEPAELMALPILHRTSQDPFHARNRFKPLRDSKSPWLTNTPTGVILSNRLSRNRFPSPDSPDPTRGSVPPPLPLWPSPEVLMEKHPSLRKPIPTKLIAGLNTSYVWQDRHRIKEGTLPKIQWEGFDRPNWESPQERINRRERQGWVRRGFQHVWEGYKARAWGHDELRPISGAFRDPFAGWGATLVDCLDTLLIMNLTLEYNYARTHVKAIDWAHTMDLSRMTQYGSSYTTSQPMISFFETVIRCKLCLDMGGLISAYDLSGDQLMLERVEELAEWLVPAFGTSSGLPQTHYQMGLNPRGVQIGRVCLAEIGSLSLEFTRLSQLTSKDFYYDVVCLVILSHLVNNMTSVTVFIIQVQKITDLLDSNQWNSSSRVGTLFPTYVNPEAPQSLSGQYTFGAMADSYYEYLVEHLLCCCFHLIFHGQKETNQSYSKMYTSVIDSARKHLIRSYDLESSGGKKLKVIGDLSWGTFKPSLDHLTCFSGAMIGLGAQLLGRKEDLEVALGVSHTTSMKPTWMVHTDKHD